MGKDDGSLPGRRNVLCVVDSNLLFARLNAGRTSIEPLLAAAATRQLAAQAPPALLYCYSKPQAG